MNRRLLALAVSISILVAMAPGATVMATAPASNLVVAGQHTTASDFQDGTLSNMRVEGSGDDGRVAYGNPNAVDEGVESGDLSNFSGNTGAFDAQTTTVYEGSYAAAHTATGDGTRNELIRSVSSDTYNASTIWINTTSEGSEYTEISLSSSGTVGPVLRIDYGGAPNTLSDYNNGTLLYYDAGNDVWLDTGVDIPTNTWVKIEFTSIDWSGDTFNADATTESGNHLGGIDVADFRNSISSANQITLSDYGAANHYDKLQVNPSGTPSNGTYTSAEYDVSQVKQGWANLSLKDTTATIEWQYYDNGWKIAASKTVSSSQNVTADLTGSSDRWRVVVRTDADSLTPDSVLSDEGYLFDARPPQLDNSTASPANDEQLTSKDVTLSIDGSDADFGTAQGDNVTLEWYVDGSKVDTTTVSSNGTWSTTVSVSSKSQGHTWHVKATDEYDETTTSDTFSFEVPSELRIFNESNPSELLDNVTAELTFYFENGSNQAFTVERTTDNGTINMTGLPADQPFVVVAQADGFISRRIWVESLFQRQRIYLLPENERHVEKSFTLEDFSGLYSPDETVLIIQRSLNGSWETVQGDYFGATDEVTAQLAYNERHRLVIINVETGDRLVKGPYTPLSDGTDTVRVLAEGEIKLVTGESLAPIVGPSLGQLPAINGTSVTLGTNESVEYDVVITYSNATTNTTLYNQTLSGQESYNIALDLAQLDGGKVIVNVTWETLEGNNVSKETVFTVEDTYTNNFSLLSTLFKLEASFPVNGSAVMGFLSVLVTVFGVGAIGATLGASPRTMGLMTLAGLAMFSIIGFVSYSVVFAGAIGYGGMIALREGL